MNTVKTKGIFKAPRDTEIHLSNPFADSFEQYIILNAAAWQTRTVVELEGVLSTEDHDALKSSLFAHKTGMAYSAKTFHDLVNPYAANYVVTPGSAKGQHLVLCGAGPSLREHIAEWAPQADQIWGCNSAVTWLAKEGHKPTHAFTVDQTPHMYLEWRDAPDDIEYLVASTIHPHLSQWLIDTGRRFRYFNNFVGIKKPPVEWADVSGTNRVMSYEEWLYALLFPTTVQAGSGLNTVTRALDVATTMGFDKITVLGADCSIQSKKPMPYHLKVGSPAQANWLRTNTTFHADGGHALASESTPLVMRAVIDGRQWLTKVDLVISAQWLMKMARASGGKIQLIGDTLPNAIKNKPEKWLARLPNLTDSQGRVMRIPF